MALTVLTYVNQISNLSDARYCAGMGVEVLGFVLTEGQPAYIPPATVKEVTGWVAGVQFAGEFYKTSVEDINLLVDSCSLTQVILNSDYLVDDITKLNIPVIQRIIINKDTLENELIEQMAVYQKYVHSFLITSHDIVTIDETTIPLLQTISFRFRILVGFGLTKENIFSVLEQVKPSGIALKGGEEIKPGLKSFDALADILEILEE